MMKKIGIMGGTFDPFHKGHYLLARTAYEQFGLDRVLILPNGNPPHKKDQVHTGIEDRICMIEAAIADTPHMELSRAEAGTENSHYTFRTLERLCKVYPGDELFFIIGADSLFDFDEWCHPERIVQSATILVAVRDDAKRSDLERQIEVLRRMLGGRFLIMNSPRVDVASKEIRQFLREGKDVTPYLEPQVIAYIREHHLY